MFIWPCILSMKWYIRPTRRNNYDTSQHMKCWKPYAVIHGLALVKIGIMMPETCWANGLLIKDNCCNYWSHISIHIHRVNCYLNYVNSALKTSTLPLEENHPPILHLNILFCMVKIQFTYSITQLQLQITHTAPSSGSKTYFLERKQKTLVG